MTLLTHLGNGNNNLEKCGLVAKLEKSREILSVICVSSRTADEPERDARPQQAGDDIVGAPRERRIHRFQIQGNILTFFNIR